MPTEALSTKATEILAALREHYDEINIDPDGREWATVCLDNARPSGITAHQFAGHLSALERAGLYRSHGDDCAGEVLIKE